MTMDEIEAIVAEVIGFRFVTSLKVSEVVDERRSFVFLLPPASVEIFFLLYGSALEFDRCEVLLE